MKTIALILSMTVATLLKPTEFLLASYQFLLSSPPASNFCFLKVLDELKKSTRWNELHVADNCCFHYGRVRPLSV